MFRRSLSLIALFVVISICIPASLRAEWFENGTPVCTAIGYQAQEVAVTDGGGGAFIVWTDGRQFPWVMITAQRIDEGGFPAWDPDGIQVCAVDTIQLQPVAAYAGDGTVMIAWISQDGPVYTVSAQKIDRDGNLLWTLDGIQITSLSGVLDNIRICPDHAGGAVFAWLDSRGGGYQVYAQRLDAEGTALWTDGGHQITSSPVLKSELQIASDGYGGAFLTWVDYTNEDIYAEWVQLGGYIAWGGTNGVPVCGEINSQEYPSIIADGAGGAIVCWDDFRSDPFGDIYAQKLEPGFGSPMWSSGVPVCTDPGAQGSVAIVSDGAAGAILVWLDGRNSDYDIYTQKLNGVGTPQWTGDGIPVCAAEGLKYFPVAESDGNGGAIISWQDNRSGSGADVYATRIDLNANILWPESGLPVCTSPFDQIVSSIAVDDMGNAIFVWNDDRNLFDGDIYAQRIDRFGKWGFPAPHIASVRDVPGDEGGQVNISWNASRLDVFPNSEIFYYTIWRSIDEELAMAMLNDGAAMLDGSSALRVADDELESDPSSPLLRRTLEAGEPYYWTEIATVYSSDITDFYAELVPTLFDSSSAGFERHYFQVVAHGYESTHYWISAPDSGYSVDNLAPDTPLGLAGEQFFTPVGMRLTWEPNSESDLAGYNVYRGTSSGFTPGPGNLVVSTDEEEIFDSEWSWEAGYWYKVSAIDINGNESQFAVLAPDVITGDDPMPVPEVTFLAQNYPNPFNPVTTIGFGLKESGHVSLRIYDAAGRLVTTLVDESRSAGRYSTEWNGKSADGSSAASGVYFYRLISKEFEETRKMILLR